MRQRKVRRPSDQQDGAARDVLARGRFRQLLQGGGQETLRRFRDIGTYFDRCICRQALGAQGLGNPRSLPGSHVNRCSRPRTAQARAMVVLLLVGIILGGCGYRLTGDRDPVIDVRTVHIPPLVNTTTKVGIETLFTNELIFEVNRHGYAEVVGRDTAQAVLEGDLRDLRTGSISRRSITTTLERRVSVTMDLRLKDRKGRLLWQSSLSDSEEYTVQADKTSTEGNLRRALAVISRRLAEKFHYRFTATF